MKPRTVYFAHRRVTCDISAMLKLGVDGDGGEGDDLGKCLSLFVGSVVQARAHNPRLCPAPSPTSAFVGPVIHSVWGESGTLLVFSPDKCRLETVLHISCRDKFLSDSQYRPRWLFVTVHRITVPLSSPGATFGLLCMTLTQRYYHFDTIHISYQQIILIFKHEFHFQRMYLDRSNISFTLPFEPASALLLDATYRMRFRAPVDTL